MKTPNEHDWDEFHDLPIVNWKRVRASIEHENTLVNHRIGWLLTSQLFLFGAFAAVFNAALDKDVLATSLQVQAFLLAVSAVGITTCLFVMVSLDAAHRQIGLLENWWIRHHLDGIKNQSQMQDVDSLKHHPPINGMLDEWMYSIFGVRWLPFPILIGWIGLLSTVFFEFVVKANQPVLWTALATLSIVVVGQIALRLLRITRKHERSWKDTPDTASIPGIEEKGTNNPLQPSGGSGVSTTEASPPAAG